MVRMETTGLKLLKRNGGVDLAESLSGGGKGDSISFARVLS